MSLPAINRIILAVAVLALLLALPASLRAADDLDTNKKKYRAIQMQIKDQEEKLKRAVESEQSTLNAIDTTNRRLHEVRQELKTYRAKIHRTEKEIGEVSSEISALNSKLDRHRKWMARKLQAMQRYGRFGDALLILVESEDTPEMMRRWRYLEELARYERGIIEDYRKTIGTLDSKEAELEALNRRLASEEAVVREAEKELAEEKAQKQMILVSVTKKKEAYERMLRELSEASKMLQKLIEDAERDKRFASKDFQKLKGQLPWPVAGKVALPYGTQKDPTFQTPVFRNGIYIAAEEGTRAKAVHGGRVVFADWFKGYGQLVILNHGGGYHSLYANLSEIFLREGDIINDRVDVGKVGDSSITDQPSLYFELRYKGKPLNPVHWLEKK